MKTLLPVLFLALVPGLCAVAETEDPAMPAKVGKKEAASRITYKGGDGSSFEKAVVIVGATSSMDGVPAEGKWLKKKYGSYEKLQQGLVQHEGKFYDVITIRTEKGKEVVVYFDISDFSLPGVEEEQFLSSFSVFLSGASACRFVALECVFVFSASGIDSFCGAYGGTDRSTHGGDGAAGAMPAGMGSVFMTQSLRWAAFRTGAK